jgi:hypothetical protein
MKETSCCFFPHNLLSMFLCHSESNHSQFLLSTMCIDENLLKKFPCRRKTILRQHSEQNMLSKFIEFAPHEIRVIDEGRARCMTIQEKLYLHYISTILINCQQRLRYFSLMPNTTTLHHHPPIFTPSANLVKV